MNGKGRSGRRDMDTMSDLYKKVGDSYEPATHEDVKEFTYPYCPHCGACGEEGCCSSDMCCYVDAYQGDYDRLIKQYNIVWDALEGIAHNLSDDAWHLAKEALAEADSV